MRRERAGWGTGRVSDAGRGRGTFDGRWGDVRVGPIGFDWFGSVRAGGTRRGSPIGARGRDAHLYETDGCGVSAKRVLDARRARDSLPDPRRSETT